LISLVGFWLMCRTCVHFDRNVKCCLFLWFPAIVCLQMQDDYFAFVKLRKNKLQDCYWWIFVPCWKTCNAIVTVAFCISCLCYIFFTWDKLFFCPVCFTVSYVTFYFERIWYSLVTIWENCKMWRHCLISFFSIKNIVSFFVLNRFLKCFVSLHFIFFSLSREMTGLFCSICW
jgi:hypothetical protein